MGVYNTLSFKNACPPHNRNCIHNGLCLIVLICWYPLHQTGVLTPLWQNNILTTTSIEAMYLRTSFRLTKSMTTLWRHVLQEFLHYSLLVMSRDGCFFSLLTNNCLNCQAATLLSMPTKVITQVHMLSKTNPSHLIICDQNKVMIEDNINILQDKNSICRWWQIRYKWQPVHIW